MGASSIINPSTGRPFEAASNGHSPTRAHAGTVRKFLQSFGAGNDSYSEALRFLDQPARFRARDPFRSHVWVMASAILNATVASQPPCGVWRETAKHKSEREASEAAAGRKPAMFTRGVHRRAIPRWLSVPVRRRLFQKGLEPDDGHPLNDVFARPNELQQSRTQLMWLTNLWLALKGECFWVKTDAAGAPTDRDPVMLWPLGPDLFEPLRENGTVGRLVGWRFTLPPYFPGKLAGRFCNLTLSEVVQFKFPNPANPERGISRLTAAALGIETYLLAQTFNRSFIRNGAAVRGVLQTDQVMEPDEEKALKDELKEKFEGAENAARTLLLKGGLKYQQVGMGPQEMAFLEQLRWGRDEVLGATGTPGSRLGVTDFVNYATQLGQDHNFWDGTVLPQLRLIEDTVDGSLLFEEPDTVVFKHDLAEVEALRAGLKDKVEVAKLMSGTELHVPPRVAFQVVGLEVPEYDGDETALVGFSLAGAPDVIENNKDGPLPKDPGALPPGDPNPEDPAADPAADEGDDAKPAAGEKPSDKRRILRTKRKLSWDRFAASQIPVENRFRRTYRQWLGKMHDETFARLEVALGKARARKAVGIAAAILPDLEASSQQLATLARPAYAQGLELAWELTLDEVGIPTFSPDDAAFTRFFRTREAIFARTVPRTLFDNLTKTLEQGFQTGETVQQLRLRVAEVYDIAGGSAKSLLVARTESAGFMNGVRDEMFELAGFTKGSWSTAQDEEVREDHQLFARAGVQAKGFDFLDLLSPRPTGRLRRPGDSEGPAAQVCNCRCLWRPEE